jgi:hypothetical protein
VKLSWHLARGTGGPAAAVLTATGASRGRRPAPGIGPPGATAALARAVTRRWPSQASAWPEVAPARPRAGPGSTRACSAQPLVCQGFYPAPAVAKPAADSELRVQLMPVARGRMSPPSGPGEGRPGRPWARCTCSRRGRSGCHRQCQLAKIVPAIRLCASREASESANAVSWSCTGAAMVRQQDASLARLRGSYCHTTINRNHRGRCRWGFGIVTLTAH